jgi:acetyltransferase
MIPEARDLTAFFEPKSIAIIGASGNFDIISGKPLRFLQEHGYQGAIYPINPRYEELAGIPCYKSILDVPGEVDLALMAVNYKLVLPILKDCVTKGVKHTIIFSSGFAETGEEGKKLQEEIAQLARESGMGICGPNCQGSVNLRNKAIGGFSAALGVKPLKVGPIGYVTQSGALGYSLFSLAQEAGVGFSCVASTGNEVDLHTLDFVEYLLEDDGTTMVIAYLEGIKNGRQFARLADRALELRKPIVTLKAGRSAVGQKAASSHTASLTGSDATFDAFARQKGIIRVDDIQTMIDIPALMQRIPELPRGRRLAIITTSGGGGILAADEAAAMGLEVPELDADTQAAIMKRIPPYGSAMNPVDITAQVINEAEGFMEVLQAIVDHPEIDALVIVISQITGGPGRQMAEDIVAMSRKTHKPITVAWATSDALVGDNHRVLTDGEVQWYKSPVRAVRAMGSLMNYAAFRDSRVASGGATSAAAEPQATGQAEAARALLAGTDRTLTEHQGKQLFSLYGIPVTGEAVAHSEDEAVTIAQKLGFPLAMKVDSPDILHKTEADALRLDLDSADAVRAAYLEIMANAKSYAPDARISGVLVQEMVTGATETIVGVNVDPQFGPTVVFGLGGIFVEILKDVAMRVAPVSRQDAMEMIEEIKGYKVLAGARGQAKADVDAIADVIVQVSRMALELEDEIAELDINPLLVLPEGKGARVADALVIKR